MNRISNMPSGVKTTLLGIKRKVDPTDVVWCTACVGNERGRTFDDMLCKF